MAVDLAERPDAAAPDDSAKRRQILEGARRVFLASGFDGASMNEVAREAGVSKGTLYVYFASKEALFEALLRADMQLQAERFFDLPDDAAPGAALQRLGVSLLAALARPQSVAQIRTVVGVTAKLPQLGRAFHEAGPAYGASRLAVWLERQTADGRLAVDDPESAAAQFVELCKASLFSRLIFGVVDSLSEGEIDANVRRAVDVFLRAYGVRTDSTSPRA